MAEAPEVGTTVLVSAKHLHDGKKSCRTITPARIVKIEETAGMRYLQLEALLPGSEPKAFENLVYEGFIAATGQAQVAVENYGKFVNIHSGYAPVLDFRVPTQPASATQAPQTGSKRSAMEDGECSSPTPTHSKQRLDSTYDEDAKGAPADGKDTWPELADQVIVRGLVDPIKALVKAGARFDDTFPTSEEVEALIKKAVDQGLKEYRSGQEWSKKNPFPVTVIADSFMDEGGILARIADICNASFSLIQERSKWKAEMKEIYKLGQCKELPFALLEALGERLQTAAAVVNEKLISWIHAKEQLEATRQQTAALSQRQNQRAGGETPRVRGENPRVAGVLLKPESKGICSYWLDFHRGMGPACNKGDACFFQHAMPPGLDPGAFEVRRRPIRPRGPQNPNMMPLGAGREPGSR